MIKTTTTSLLAVGMMSVALIFIANASSADAAIYVKIPGVPGDATIDVPGYDDGTWFVADSFSFGVEREMKESGEKAGTADINIGIGELQPVSISKSMDSASAKLAQFAINGNSLGTAEIDFVEIGGSDSSDRPLVYLKYKLDRAFIKSWSTSGDADDRPTEEVAFYYNKIAFVTNPTPDTVKSSEQVASLDIKKKGSWTDVIDSLLDAVFPPKR